MEVLTDGFTNLKTVVGLCLMNKGLSIVEVFSIEPRVIGVGGGCRPLHHQLLLTNNYFR